MRWRRAIPDQIARIRAAAIRAHIRAPLQIKHQTRPASDPTLANPPPPM
jgi:hypothetical protein